MQILPAEIVDLVLDFVGPLPHARAVCRQWSAIIGACWARHPKRRLSTNMYMDLLGEHNARSVIEWTRDNGCRWYASACAGAARRGHLALLQWLRANGCPWHPLTYPWAVVHKHADLVAWLAGTDCAMEPRRWWKAAILGGHREIVAWLDARYPWPTGSCCVAAQAGRTDILQMAKSNGVDCNRGHRHIIEWLRDQGEPLYGAIAGNAAKYGHFDLLKWLYAQGCELSTTTFLKAVRGAPMPILEWLRDHQCPLRIETCKKNARTDNVRVWLDTCGDLDGGCAGLWSRTVHDGDNDDSLNMP